MDLRELERRKDDLETRIAERERHLLVLVQDVRGRLRRVRTTATGAVLAGVTLLGVWTLWHLGRAVYRRLS